MAALDRDWCAVPGAILTGGAVPGAGTTTRHRLKVRLGSIWLGRKASSLIWAELLLLSSFGFLRDMLGVPGSVIYLIDVVNLILFVAVIVRGRYDNAGGYYRYAYGLCVLYLLTTVVGVLVAGGSLTLYLWGLRNNFRFYAFFVCCVSLLDARDVLKVPRFFKVLFFVNVALCALEQAMGYSGDFIGGSFGIERGGNGYLNVALAIASAIYVAEYLEARASLAMLALVLGLSFYVMSVAELKVYPVELALIVVSALLGERISHRSLILVLVVVVGTFAGLVLMQAFFSSSGIGFFTSDAIAQYMGDSGYTGTGDLNRMNAIGRITTMFFSEDPSRLLFGFGLGNCSYSSNFAFLTSPFYSYYSWLHYTWLSDAFVYLEMGASGLACFESFFVLVLAVSRMKRYRDPKLRMVTHCAGVVALLAILFSVYNSSMTTEPGYLAYLVLATPFILDKYRKAGGAKHGDRI